MPTMANPTKSLIERVEYVWRTCGYPTQTAFMKALGKDPQNYSNWGARNSLGRSGIEIAELTGASLDYLLTGRGEPFPNGPKMAERRLDDALLIRRLENDIDALRLVVAAMAKALAYGARDAAIHAAETLHSELDDRMREKGFADAVLGVLEAELSSAAAAPASARRRGGAAPSR